MGEQNNISVHICTYTTRSDNKRNGFVDFREAKRGLTSCAIADQASGWLRTHVDQPAKCIDPSPLAWSTRFAHSLRPLASPTRFAHSLRSGGLRLTKKNGDNGAPAARLASEAADRSVRATQAQQIPGQHPKPGFNGAPVPAHWRIYGFGETSEGSTESKPGRFRRI